MKQRCALDNILNIDIYILSMDDNITFGRLTKIKMNEKGNLSFFKVAAKDDKEKILFSKESIIHFINRFRNNKIQYEKIMCQVSSLVSLEKRMFNAGIKLGGNLDGFKIENNQIKIIEFSKIGAKNPNQFKNDQNTRNYNFNSYISVDYGRWHALQSNTQILILLGIEIKNWRLIKVRL